MSTTASQIGNWFSSPPNAQCTHMIVATDTFDWTDYPVYVGENEDIHERINHFRTAPMSKVMEVYSYSLPFEDQVKEFRAFFI